MVKPGYKQTEVGLIPEDWEARPIGSMFTFKNGLNKAKEFFGYGTPIVNYMDVFSYPGLHMENVKGRVDVNKQELKAFNVSQGDVFFTRTSETVEEIGVSSVMLDESPNTVFSGFILRGRPRGADLDDQFKKYCFSSHAVRKQITSKSTYTTRALTNGRMLSAVVMPKPSTLDEQKAIADALGDVDELIAAIDALIAKKRVIKQAAMQQLLTGKTRLPGFSGEWQVKRLGDSCELITKGTTPTSIGRNFTESGVNFLKAESVSESGTPIPDKVAFIDTTTHKLLGRSQLKKGDLLISIAGVLGRVGRVVRDILPANINQALAIIRLGKSSELERSFLFFYLRSPMTLKQIAYVNVQAAQANISLQNVRDLEIYVPPSLPEQSAIASVLSDMDAELSALLARRGKTRDLKQTMMQELLTGRIRLI